MQTRIIDALDRQKIVLVTGLRGTGKTTLLRSVQARLERSRGGGTVFQDLEDPRLAPRPRKETLEMFSKDGRTIFLDEVGRVDGWLDWARRSRGRGVVASQSGPRLELPAQDLVQLTLHPMGPNEVNKLTGKSVDMESYLKGGGLPGAALSGDPRAYLVDLFNLCLYKDVIQKHQVRDIDRLTAMAVYLLASTSRQVSASRLKGLLSRSVDQARGFLAHLARSGLIHLVPRIEDGRRVQARAARRCFSADCGLSVALSGRELAIRDLAETAVFHQLLRRGHRVQAWRARGRLGLAVAGEDRPGQLIDVGYRERSPAGTGALAAAMAAHSCPSGLLLGDDEGEESIPVAAGTIRKQNLKKWLQDIDSETKDESAPAGLPPHLL